MSREVLLSAYSFSNVNGALKFVLLVDGFAKLFLELDLSPFQRP
jgi:hypothetical protein